MAAFAFDHGSEEGLQGGLPGCRVRLHHYSDIPIWSDWIHGLLQGSEPQCEGAVEELEPSGGGEVVQVLQQGGSSRKLCAADVRKEGLEIAEEYENE
jgi:hypothetical protein